MSDEAFARRFYSDRAELLSLGVPLSRSATSSPARSCTRSAPSSTSSPSSSSRTRSSPRSRPRFYLLEGKFAYAEPLRLALQNLALGRPGFVEAPTETAGRVEVLDPDYSPETPGRLAKLENAISKQRTVKFEYWSISSDKTKERTLNPYALLNDDGALVRRRPRSRPQGHPHVPRLARSRRHQVRDAPRARLPGAGRLRRRAVPRPAAVADRRHRRHGADRGARRHRMVGAACVRHDRHARGRRLRHRLLLHRPARLVGAAPERPRRAARAARAEAEGRRGAAARARRPRGSAAAAGAGEGHARAPTVSPERPAGPVAPERFAVLQALLAFLLAACGEERTARDFRRRAVGAVPVGARRRARGAPLPAQPRQLRRRLLHGLRRAAGRRRCTSTRSCGATRSARRRA